MAPTLPLPDLAVGRSRRIIRLIAVAGISLGALVQQPTRPPVVLEFAVGDSVAADDAEIPLIHRLAGGRPTHYRIGHRPDFADATWLPYQGRLRWRSSRDGSGPPCSGRPDGMTVHLYFQVRSVLGEEVRIVDGRRVVVPLASESNVQSAAVCVTPKAG